MGTTIAVRFPLGRYHANPWDRSVNEGAAEWPPSPWRVLRALVATWYTRWPALPAAAFDAVLDALSDLPSYRTPVTLPGHTRHYLPDLDHKKGETGGTGLTLDPFLSIPRDGELLIRWDTDLSGDQRETLAKLTELLPYLGRAESVCEARLLDDDLEPDESWWRPGADGAMRARLLAPDRPIDRGALEISTLEVRKQRRTLPPGTAWVNYAAAAPVRRRPAAPRKASPVEAVRFAVTGRIPLKSKHAVLLADDAHRLVGKVLADAGFAEERRSAILGTGGATTDHRHAHWVPLAQGHERGASVPSFVLWVPGGLDPREVAAVIDRPTLSGRRGRRQDGDRYEVRGFPEVRLLFEGAGRIDQVAPELCGPARRWRSLTPYLPVRHRKPRHGIDRYLAADVAAELRYRDQPAATVTPVDPGGGVPDRWAREFRRYRLTERMDKSRPGLGLQLEFTDQVRGPLLLGKLSHFGFGIFTPEPG